MLNSDQAIFCANCRAEMAGAGVGAPAPALATPAPPVTTVPPVAPVPPVVPFRPESSTVRTLLGILAEHQRIKPGAVRIFIYFDDIYQPGYSN
jgi:hypothetical protein